MASEPIIRIRDLVVGFGDRTVLDGVSVDVNQGEIFGFVGGSGSGKSVLLRTVIGLIQSRSGTIDVLGHRLTGASQEQRRQIERRWGILFQQGALFSSLSVIENVQFPMREFLDLSPRMLNEVARLKLELVGLDAKDCDKFPSELSGGMIKRVALARALALDPELVFLDEPTSGLDPISAGDFDALIRTMQQTLGLTVFMITHDLQSLYTVCDRVGVLADGKVVAIGSIQEILKSPHAWVQEYFRGHRASALNSRFMTTAN
ncbi:MAG: ATP-binding cassette domain-containing protein [Hyphomicrobiaceae bacterium]|nr:ATP-binding cassette domain-containing protein [Hyphomicrobiaceae bacterium]